MSRTQVIAKLVAAGQQDLADRLVEALVESNKFHNLLTKQIESGLKRAGYKTTKTSSDFWASGLAVDIVTNQPRPTMLWFTIGSNDQPNGLTVAEVKLQYMSRRQPGELQEILDDTGRALTGLKSRAGSLLKGGKVETFIAPFDTYSIWMEVQTEDADKLQAAFQKLVPDIVKLTKKHVPTDRIVVSAVEAASDPIFTDLLRLGRWNNTNASQAAKAAAEKIAEGISSLMQDPAFDEEGDVDDFVKDTTKETVRLLQAWAKKVMQVK